MAKARFSRHPSFPIGSTRVTGGGMLWKLEVREWAFAQVDLTDVDAGLTPTSNNPNVVTDHYQNKPDKIKGTMAAGSREMTVRFYAKSRGFTFIQLFGNNPATAVSDLLQVEVLQRRANDEAHISLTVLLGKTCAINAPDAKAYEMDSTLTFDKASTDPTKIFSSVPSGLNHLVISSHGGFQDRAAMGDVKNMSLYVCGGDTALYRLTLADVEKAFETLKGKILADGVIWIGGCTIGSNIAFCAAAARGAKCPVVAPGYALVNKKFSKGKVDILDGMAMPKVFVPDAGTKLIHASEFCAAQDGYKFEVPV